MRGLKLILNLRGYPVRLGAAGLGVGSFGTIKFSEKVAATLDIKKSCDTMLSFTKVNLVE